MTAGLGVFLMASGALFAVGAFAVMARRSAVMLLIGGPFMFAAGAIAFVAFGRFGRGATEVNAGPSMALFVVLTAVAQLTLGAAMVVILYRENQTLFPDSDGE